MQPVIPNHIVIEALKSKGIQILSHISEIRASTSKPGRTHIMSFRRQFYMKEEDESSLPETLQITFDNTTYWTYLSTDSASCFVCKQTWHISKACPNATSNLTNFLQPSPINENNLISSQKSIPGSVVLFNQLLNQKRPPPTTNRGKYINYGERVKHKKKVTLLQEGNGKKHVKKGKKLK